MLDKYLTIISLVRAVEDWDSVKTSKKGYYRTKYGVHKWRSGESTRLPLVWIGSIPGLGVICGLSLLVLHSAPRGFLRTTRHLNKVPFLCVQNSLRTFLSAAVKYKKVHNNVNIALNSRPIQSIRLISSVNC